MADQHDDDLNPTKTEGFKVGEKKTVEEYQKLDANDESLNRWKASLGLSGGTPISDPNDPRKCIIKALALEVEGRSDITVDLSAPGSVEQLKNKPFTIKEGSKFRMKATFQVQHEVLSGLKYVQVVKRKGVRVSKDQEMLVSLFGGVTFIEASASHGAVLESILMIYTREALPQTRRKSESMKKINEEQAPSGMLARGHYTALSRFVDDDDHTHLQFEWSFDIAKDW
ncbi:rho GDP dissociation inhibitor [Emydomyces testavorans]|uniref:Rho GDP dissociation inhibitor n=1 Tax=Emydomyces testavorans TaxID=2070801 RepID=A0AAF0ILM7_9EURO|nr:rho GDP dissociation inhibitor [Emydomyces testavorans]